MLTAQTLHRKHVIGIFTCYSYEITRKTARLCECTYMTDLLVDGVTQFHYAFQAGLQCVAVGQSLIHRCIYIYPWFLAGHLASRVEAVGQSQIHNYCLRVSPAGPGNTWTCNCWGVQRQPQKHSIKYTFLVYYLMPMYPKINLCEISENVAYDLKNQTNGKKINPVFWDSGVFRTIQTNKYLSCIIAEP